MRPYATAQLIGDRSHQCDATATAAGPNGTRAFVLLDGIGSTDEIRDWTRAAAHRLARAAAHHGDADPDRHSPWIDLPNACAVVAVASPRWLTVAWCGDVRAYLMVRGTVQRLTADHNLRRVFRGNRNIVTSFLGNFESDAQVKDRYGHPAIETVTRQQENSRLLLASDGAYEPLEDSCRNLADYLTGDPRAAARDFVTSAIEHASARADNATVLVADLRP